MTKRYELIFTVIKYGEDRSEANEQVEYIHKMLKENNEDYSYSTYCTGRVYGDGDEQQGQ